MAKRKKRQKDNQQKSQSANLVTEDKQISSLPPWFVQYAPYIVLFLLAFSLRILFIFDKSSVPFEFELYEGTDSLSFHQMAKEITGGNWNQAPFVQAPAYIYCIAFIYKFFSANPLLINLIQAVIGSLTCVILVNAAHSLMNRFAAWCVGIIAAVYQMFIFYDGLLFQETFLVFWVVMYVWLAVKMESFPRRKSSFYLGILCGISCLFKPIFIPVFLLLLLYLCWGSPRQLPYQCQLSAISCGTAFLILSPVIWMNANAGAGWVISQNGPVEFLDGNMAGVSGFTQYEAAGKDQIQTEYYGDWLPVFHAVFHSYENKPGLLFELYNRKFWMMWNAYEPPQNVNVYLVQRYSWFLQFPLLSFRGLLCLAIPGLALIQYYWRQYKIIAGIFCILFLVVISFFVIARFRLLIVPLLMLFSGVYISTLFQIIQTKQWGKLMFSLLVSGSIYFLNNPVPEYLLRPTDYFLILTHFNQTNQNVFPIVEEAFAQYDAGIESAPNDFYHALAHYNKANFAFSGRPNFNEIVIEHANRAHEIGGDNFPKRDMILFMLNTIQNSQ